jgi:23S rRNA (cytosine1962-C5)-methyltransferase
LQDGHLWVYEGHVAAVRGDPRAGDLVDLVDGRTRWIGCAFFNPHSKIRARLLTTEEVPIDEAFWRARLQASIRYRERVVQETTAYRLVHGEADFLPGLIVDRFDDLLVLQTLSYGMDIRREGLAGLARELTGTVAVYERNDSGTRSLEGLARRKGFLLGRAPTCIEIVEGAARFRVDVGEGQKTGWYCDQRENRLAVSAYAKGARVLEAFCHTGAFGVHAALGGALSVEGLDASEEAIQAALAHAELNHVSSRCGYRACDVFEELPRLVKAGSRYDLIILDPPAFAKTKGSVARALAGYKQINLRALQLLAPEGLLVTCSCSYHVSDEALWQAVSEAARDARRPVRLVESRSQARDHPMLAGMPETRYLSCFIAQVMEGTELRRDEGP